MAKHSLAWLAPLALSLQMGCSENPVKSANQSIRVEMSAVDTHAILIDYFVFNNHRIDENTDTYIKAFASSNFASDFGDHGNFIHTWLETEGRNVTLVIIDVTKEGNVWDSKEDAKVISLLKRYLRLRSIE